MPNLAQITIAGHIGSDAETKTVNDTTVTEFSVAVNDRKDNTHWYRIAVWGKYGQVLQDLLTKGKVVTVIGDFTPRQYTSNEGETRYSFDIRASSVIVAGDGNRNDSQDSGSSDSPQNIDDIPF